MRKFSKVTGKKKVRKFSKVTDEKKVQKFSKVDGKIKKCISGELKSYRYSMAKSRSSVYNGGNSNHET